VAASRAASADFRLAFAAHATLEAGTGLVHTARATAPEDYTVGRAEGLEIYAPVDSRGRYNRRGAAVDWPARAGSQPQNRGLAGGNRLSAHKPGETVRHQYPHCWRCKHPVLFRATSQWFARLGDRGDATSLREKALAEIDLTQWIPTWGKELASAA